METRNNSKTCFTTTPQHSQVCWGVPRVAVGSVLIWFFLILLPLSTYAQVIISEIMYDAPGADTGREWIEIENTSASPVNLSGWKLNEQGVNHGLIVVQGTSTLASGGFAIIASDPKKFRIDWPSYSGNIFDSSFSLSNTGETFSIKSSSSTVVDQISYSSSQGASGDGESLQRVSGSWVASSPTPGARNVIVLHVPAPPTPVAPTVPPARKVVAPTSAKAKPTEQKTPRALTNATTSSSVLPPVTKNSSLKWYLLLGLVVIIGVVAYWIGGRKKEGELTAEDFTIIEEKE